MRQPAFVSAIPIGTAKWSPGRTDRWYWKRGAALTARTGLLSMKLSSTSPRDGMQLQRPDKADRGWVRSMQSLPQSTVFANTWPEVIAAFAWSSLVVLAHSLLKRAFGLRYAVPSLSTTPHAFLSTALSLVLVFRTNAAYDRYWEGRKVWGGIINTAYVKTQTFKKYIT
jgi:hypothetical protein